MPPSSCGSSSPPRSHALPNTLSTLNLPAKTAKPFWLVLELVQWLDIRRRQGAAMMCGQLVGHMGGV